jgi:uncharacterized damage-inducible protein DinB
MATAVTAPQTRDEILARIDETWHEWLSAVEAVPPDRREEPGVCGYWSLKDLVAHIALWESVVAEHIQRWENGFPTADHEVDAMNAEIVAENRGRSFRLVRVEMHRAHQVALAAITGIEGDLDDDVRDRIACETWDHYPEHTEQIRAWLEQANGGAKMDPVTISERYAQRVDRALSVVESVPRERREEKGVTGQWSVKDLLAHLAYWDGVNAAQLEAEFAGGTILDDDRESDVINAEQFALRADWSWDKVMDDVRTNRDRRAELLKRPSRSDMSRSGEHWLAGSPPGGEKVGE